MNRKKELQRQLGSRYSYERHLGDREIQKLRRCVSSDFAETTAASLLAGCLRLDAVLYRASRELLLGYDVYVKDDPDSPEWICYDSLSDPVSLKEADMVSVLDRIAAERRLSYTESCFAKLDGKMIKAEKPSP